MRCKMDRLLFGRLVAVAVVLASALLSCWFMVAHGYLWRDTLVGLPYTVFIGVYFIFNSPRKIPKKVGR